MVKLKLIIPVVFFSLVFFSCNKKKEGTLFKVEDASIVQDIIESNPEHENNSDQIARLYYAQIYPEFKNENLTVSTTWKDNYLHVELQETLSNSPDMEAVKVIVVYHRPMGKLKVHQVKHAWKCKGKLTFSAEPCTED